MILAETTDDSATQPPILILHLSDLHCGPKSRFADLGPRRSSLTVHKIPFWFDVVVCLEGATRKCDYPSQ